MPLYKKVDKRILKGLEKIKTDRPSPPYHAADLPNCIMIHNNLYWVSIPDKNGIFKWKRLKEMEECKTAYEYYSQFNTYKKKYDIESTMVKYKNIMKELRKHHIYVFNAPSWKSTTMFVDNAWEDVAALVKKQTNSDNEMEYSFIFPTAGSTFRAEYTDGELILQYHMLKKDRQIIMDTFKKYFGPNLIFPK